MQLNSTSSDMTVFAGTRPFPIGFLEVAIVLPNSELLTPSASINDRAMTEREKFRWKKNGFVRNKNTTLLTLRRKRETSVEVKLVDSPRLSRLKMPPHTFSLLSNFLMVMDVTIRANKSTLTKKNDDDIVNVEVQMNDELFVYATACTLTGILERMQGAYESRKESYPPTGSSNLCPPLPPGDSNIIKSIEPYDHGPDGATRQFQVNTYRVQSHTVKEGHNETQINNEVDGRLNSEAGSKATEATVGAERVATGVLLKNPYNKDSGLMPRDLIMSFVNVAELLKDQGKRRQLVSDAQMPQSALNERFDEIYNQDGVQSLRDTTRLSLPSFEEVKGRFAKWEAVYDRLKLCLQYLLVSEPSVQNPSLHTNSNLTGSGILLM